MLLTIEIDNAGLEAIASVGQTVTLARRVYALVESMATSPLVVAWQAFAPQANNIVEWAALYSGFASTSPIALEVPIVMNSLTSAPVSPTTWLFEDGYFTAASKGTKQYQIINKSSSTLGFGLAQSASVNGSICTKPICMSEVLVNEDAIYQTSDACSIFLSSFKNGGVQTIEPQNALLVENGVDAATVGFNDTTNAFYRIS